MFTNVSNSNKNKQIYCNITLKYKERMIQIPHLPIYSAKRSIHQISQKKKINVKPQQCGVELFEKLRQENVQRSKIQTKRQITNPKLQRKRNQLSRKLTLGQECLNYQKKQKQQKRQINYESQQLDGFVLAKSDSNCLTKQPNSPTERTVKNSNKAKQYRKDRKNSKQTQAYEDSSSPLEIDGLYYPKQNHYDRISREEEKKKKKKQENERISYPNKKQKLFYQSQHLFGYPGTFHEEIDLLFQENLQNALKNTKQKSPKSLQNQQHKQMSYLPILPQSIKDIEIKPQKDSKIYIFLLCISILLLLLQIIQ